MLVSILPGNTRRKLGIRAQTLRKVLYRDAKADARGATQIRDRGGQAAARGNCFSQAFERGAEAAARRGVSCASQVLDRVAQAVARGASICAPHVPNLGAWRHRHVF
jgi:hypothetical protein